MALVEWTINDVNGQIPELDAVNIYAEKLYLDINSGSELTSLSGTEPGSFRLWASAKYSFYGSGASPASIVLHEASNNGSSYIQISAPASLSSVATLTLPTSTGTIALTSDIVTPSAITVANESADTTCFVGFFTADTGDLQPKTNANLTYNSSTNVLASGGFEGDLVGNADTATALLTARTIGGVSFDGTANITPANITIANEAADATCFPLFTTAATGNLPPKSNASFTFDSTTANLACTTFTGAFVGNVTGNVSGSSGSCTGNAATVTTNANLTGPITSVGNATTIADAELSAIAGLTSAANKVPMFSGSGTATLLDFKDEDDMTSNSATAVPSQQSVKAYVDANAGSLVKISSTTASNSTSIEFTSLSTTYRDFLIVLSNVRPATDAVAFYLRTSSDNGSTYDAGASDYAWTAHEVYVGGAGGKSDGADNEVELAQNWGNLTTENLSGWVRIHNPQEALYTRITYQVTFSASDGNPIIWTGGGVRKSAADVDAIRFLASSGNLTSGTFTLYGVKA